MGNVDLGGFDVVVHLAEGAINQGLELVPNGSTFPLRERRQITLLALGVPVPGIGNPTRDVPLLYDAFLELERPQIALNQSTGRVTVICNLSPASQLTFLRAVNAADVPLLTGTIPQIALAGSVVLDCPFGVADVAISLGGQIAAGRSAVARAAGVTATMAVLIPSADSDGDVLLASSVVNAADVTVSTADVRTALAGAFGGAIGTRLGDLPLTNPVRLNAGDLAPEIARNVMARISPVGTPPAISLGVLTGVVPGSPGGTIPAPLAVLGALGALVTVSNYWLVHLVCSLLRRAHPGMTFTFSQDPPSAHFEGAVAVPGGEEPITIRRLDVEVLDTGGLFIDGDATAQGSCWTAKIPFKFVFTFTCNPETGAVIPAVPEDSISAIPEVEKDLLCLIVGAIVGAVVGAVVGVFIGGGPIGAAIGALVGGVAGFVITDKIIIDPIDLDGVNLDSISVLGGLTLPLPIASGGLFVETCDVDDLELRARIVYVDLAERHRSGSVVFAAGAGFDLDAGTVRNALDGVSDDRADLYWNGKSLQTLPGATIGPSFDWRSTAFETLSLTDLERFSYSASSVSLEALAGRSRLGAKVTFAVRTDEGRYAKCRARRDLTGRCSLEYVVYARPAACLSTMVTLDTLSRTVVESGTEICTDVREETPYQSPLVDVRPADLPDLVVSTALLRLPPGGEPDAPELPLPGRLADRFHVDFGTLVADPVRPPRGPLKPPCGTHRTVERHVVEWQVVDRQQQAVVHILPVGLTPPMTYEWAVFGTPLTGSGTSTVASVTVTHDENSPILTLVAGEGVDLTGLISVRVTDADGRKVRVARYVSSPSRTRSGGCCPHPVAKLTFEGARRQLEELRVAERVYDAGMARLRRIAALGRVREVETIPFAEAVARIGDVKAARGGGRKAARRR